LEPQLLDYASLDIIQLRTIHKIYSDVISKYPHIRAESKRYVEFWKQERRPVGVWFVDHGILPQEILERSLTTRKKYDKFGTRSCGGCQRTLHQESFQCLFKNWETGQLCYTCAQAKHVNSRRMLGCHQGAHRNTSRQSTSFNPSVRYEGRRVSGWRDDDDYDWSYRSEWKSEEEYDIHDDWDFWERAARD